MGQTDRRGAAHTMRAVPLHLAGADLGGVTRVTSHPPGAAAYSMLLLRVSDLSYFDVILCPS